MSNILITAILAALAWLALWNLRDDWRRWRSRAESRQAQQIWHRSLQALEAAQIGPPSKIEWRRLRLSRARARRLVRATTR